MKCFVTGCAGFIGSNLTDRLLEKGNEVIGYDNLSTGQPEFLEKAESYKTFSFIEGDILDLQTLIKSMKDCEIVYHFAANADVRFGVDHPDRDIIQNTIGTFNVLEAMRLNKIKRIAFSSTSAIYGLTKTYPTPENDEMPIQTSLYSASKLSAESFIEAFCNGFDMVAYMFRFVSILGERYSHGHVYDFYKQLHFNPKKLIVLGDGTQSKSYLYVQDCIDAIFLAQEKSKENVNIYNLGLNIYMKVSTSIDYIRKCLGLSPQIIYKGGNRGWIGDNPFIFLDCKKIRNLGWKPKTELPEAIEKTVSFIKANEWILERR